MTADGLVVATPALAASPTRVFDSFFAVLGDKALSGMPVLLALNNGSQWQPPDLAQVMRTRLTSVHAELVRTVAGPADWQTAAGSSAGRLRTGIDRAAVELATAMRSRRQ